MCTRLESPPQCAADSGKGAMSDCRKARGAPVRSVRWGWLHRLPKGPWARRAGQRAWAGSAVCRKARGAPGRSARLGWLRRLPKGPWTRPAGQCAGAGSAVCRKTRGAPGRSMRWGRLHRLPKGRGRARQVNALELLPCGAPVNPEHVRANPRSGCLLNRLRRMVEIFFAKANMCIVIRIRE